MMVSYASCRCNCTAHPSCPIPPAALWVVTNETGVTWNHAYLHGKVSLAHYWAGDNDRGAKLRPTNPLLALLEFGAKGELLPVWRFAGYLPHDCQVGGWFVEGSRTRCQCWTQAACVREIAMVAVPGRLAGCTASVVSQLPVLSAACLLASRSKAEGPSPPQGRASLYRPCPQRQQLLRAQLSRPAHPGAVLER